MSTTRPSRVADPFDDPDYAYLKPSAPTPRYLRDPGASPETSGPGSDRLRVPRSSMHSNQDDDAIRGRPSERPSMRRRISRSVDDDARREHDRGRDRYQDQYQDRLRHHSEQRHRQDSWDRNRDNDEGRDFSRRRFSRYPPLSGSGASPRLGGDEWQHHSFRSPRPDDDIFNSPRWGSSSRHRDGPYDDSRRRSHRHYEDDPDFDRPQRRNSLSQHDLDFDDRDFDRPQRRNSLSQHDLDFDDRPRRRGSRHSDDDWDRDDHRRRRYSSADRHRPHHGRDRNLDHDRDGGRNHDRGGDRDRPRRRDSAAQEEKDSNDKRNLLKSILWGAAFQAGLGAALDMRSKPGPWMGEKGAKVATAAAASGLVDTFFNVKKPDRQGGIRHQAAKVGLTEGLGMAVNKAVARGI